MPFTDLLEGEAPTGTFKSREEMKAVFTAAGVNLDAPMICSCGSGCTAAVLSLAAYDISGDLVRPSPSVTKAVFYVRSLAVHVCI